MSGTERNLLHLEKILRMAITMMMMMRRRRMNKMVDDLFHLERILRMAITNQ